MVVGLSPRKAAVTIYGVYNDYGPVVPLFDDLGPHTTGKGCLYLKSLDGIDLERARDAGAGGVGSREEVLTVAG